MSGIDEDIGGVVPDYTCNKPESVFLTGQVYLLPSNGVLDDFKILTNLVFRPFVLFTYHPQPNLRINHNKQLSQPLARTVSFSCSYFVSSVKLWNCLPPDIVACTSLSVP